MFMAESYVGHKVCRPGDVVVNTMWAWMAAVGVSRHVGIVSPAYGVYRPRNAERFEPKYLDYLLRTEIYRAEYLRSSRGITTSRLRLYPPDFLNIPFVQPPLDEQRLIVRFLDWHGAQTAKLIRAKKRIIALLNEEKQATVHNAVTRGFDSKTKLKPSGVAWLGSVPEHWEVVRSGSMFRLFGGFAFDGSSFIREETEEHLPILLTPVNFDPVGGLRFGPKSTVRFRGAVPSQFELARGALVTVLTDLSSKRLILGRAGFIDRDGVLLNQRTARVDIHASQRSRLDVKYLCWVLNSTPVREQTISTSRGSTVFHTSPGRMLAARWPLPPTEEQHTIIRKLEALEASHQVIRSHLLSKIDLLREYLGRITVEVVTGKLDVRTLAAALPDFGDQPTEEAIDDEEFDEAADDTEFEEAAA